MNLKWNFLLNLNWKRKPAIAFGSFGMLAAFFGCLAIQGAIFGLGNPNALTFVIMASAWLLTSVVMEHGHKLHWSSDLSVSQYEAIRWYRGLSDKEKEQLPVGWDDLVSEHGDEPHGRIYLARFMQNEAQDVIRLYRQSVTVAKIPDHRIELFTTLMQQRQEELNNYIDDRAEVEATIAQMD